MKDIGKGKWIGAGIVLIVAALGIWLVVGSADESAGEDSMPSWMTEQGMPDVRLVRFDVNPGMDGMPSAMEEVRQTLSAALNKNSESSQLDLTRQAGLIDLYITQLELLINPDIDKWLSHVEAFGGDPRDNLQNKPARDADGQITPEFAKKWKDATTPLKDSQLSVESMIVRARRINGVNLELEPPHKMVGAGITGHYEPLRSGSTNLSQIWEIMIPMQYRQSRVVHPMITFEDGNALVGLHFSWNELEGRWTPLDLILYMEHDIQGPTQLPAF